MRGVPALWCWAMALDGEGWAVQRWRVVTAVLLPVFGSCVTFACVFAGIRPPAEVWRERSKHLRLRFDAHSGFGVLLFYIEMPMIKRALLRYRRNMLASRKGSHGTEYSVKGYSGILIRTPVL